MSIGMEPAHGWGGEDPIVIQAYNHTGGAAVKGTPGVLDLVQAESTYVKNNDVGHYQSGLANMDAIGANQGAKAGIVGIALEPIAEHGYGKWMLRGICKALIGTSTPTTDDEALAGNYVWLETGSAFLDVVGANVGSDTPLVGHGARAPAILLDDTDASLTKTPTATVRVLFNGIAPYKYYWTA